VATVAAALVLVAGCGDDDGGEEADATTTTAGVVGPVAPSTVPPDGDPEYCAALADFQAHVTTVSEPPAEATPASIEQAWDDLARAEGQMIEHAPDELVAATQSVVTAFDQFRLDAAALDYDYDTFADLESSSSIDPGSAIAAAAASLFTYGDLQCPEPDPEG
jgi:hypothetical protein